MTGMPVLNVIESPLGRARHVPPVAGTDDCWILTLGRDPKRHVALFLARLDATAGPLRLYTHQLTVCDLLAEPAEGSAAVEPDVRKMFMQHLRLRGGRGQAVRLARLLVHQVMDGALEPVPLARTDLADWRIAIGLGIPKALSEDPEFAEIAYVTRSEDV